MRLRTIRQTNACFKLCAPGAWCAPLSNDRRPSDRASATSRLPRHSELTFALRSSLSTICWRTVACNPTSNGVCIQRRCPLERTPLPCGGGLMCEGFSQSPLARVGSPLLTRADAHDGWVQHNVRAFSAVRQHRSPRIGCRGDFLGVQARKSQRGAGGTEALTASSEYATTNTHQDPKWQSERLGTQVSSHSRGSARSARRSIARGGTAGAPGDDQEPHASPTKPIEAQSMTHVSVISWGQSDLVAYVPHQQKDARCL